MADSGSVSRAGWRWASASNSGRASARALHCRACAAALPNGEGEQGPEDSDAKKEKKEADPDKLKKAIIQVKHDDRPARLILNRRPPAEGWAWLKYEDDGHEFEADLSSVQLVALLEG